MREYPGRNKGKVSQSELPQTTPVSFVCPLTSVLEMRQVRYSLRGLLGLIAVCALVFTLVRLVVAPKLNRSRQRAIVQQAFPNAELGIRYDTWGDVTDLEIMCNPLSFSESNLQNLAQLRKLRVLSLPGSGISDKGLREIGQLNQLIVLDLNETHVTDAGLAELGNLTKLEMLRLCRTNITDEGIEHLAKMHGLDVLELADTKVTDAGLASLSGLKKLEYLYIKRTGVTRHGVRKLQERLPACKIEYE